MTSLSDPSTIHLGVARGIPSLVVVVEREIPLEEATIPTAIKPRYGMRVSEVGPNLIVKKEIAVLVKKPASSNKEPHLRLLKEES